MIHMYILKYIISYYIMLHYIEHPQVLTRHDPARIPPPRDLFLGHSDALLSDLCRNKGFSEQTALDYGYLNWCSKTSAKKHHGRLCIVKQK